MALLQKSAIWKNAPSIGGCYEIRTCTENPHWGADAGLDSAGNRSRDGGHAGHSCSVCSEFV